MRSATASGAVDTVPGCIIENLRVRSPAKSREELTRRHAIGREVARINQGKQLIGDRESAGWEGHLVYGLALLRRSDSQAGQPAEVRDVSGLERTARAPELFEHGVARRPDPPGVARLQERINELVAEPELVRLLVHGLREGTGGRTPLAAVGQDLGPLRPGRSWPSAAPASRPSSDSGHHARRSPPARAAWHSRRGPRNRSPPRRSGSRRG